VAFSHRGIPFVRSSSRFRCTLIEFPEPSLSNLISPTTRGVGPPGALPTISVSRFLYVLGSEAVIDWVVNYFSTSQTPRNAFESIQVPPIVTTEKMPLILQHEGHSRMIIGYEVDRNGARSLLTFDPALYVSSLFAF